MTECDFCKTPHVVNTVFCDECGHYLLGMISRDTDPLEASEIGWIGEPTPASPPKPSLPRETGPLGLSLKMNLPQAAIDVSLNRVVTLGRIDPVSGSFPDIDLTYVGELSLSVSRRHANIFVQKGFALVEDLASINGTFLNGKRLIPFVPEILNDNDTLQLGKLLITVRLKN
jgi:hypothetical protein